MTNDEFVSSWKLHELSACIGGLPADEPSLFISFGSLAGLQRRWPNPGASIECLNTVAVQLLGM